LPKFKTDTKDVTLEGMKSCSSSSSDLLVIKDEHTQKIDSHPAQWIQAMQVGDIPSFEHLFDLYKNKVYVFIKNSLLSHADAEELTQEVFIKIWTNRKKIDPEKSISAYIYTIAKNEIYDFLRKKLNQKKYIESIVKEQDFKTDHIEQNLFYKETHQLIHKLINQLPERRRRIFELSRLEGNSYREIAEQLNISENTVDTQIRQALKYLRQHIHHTPLLSLPIIKIFL